MNPLKSSVVRKLGSCQASFGHSFLLLLVEESVFQLVKPTNKKKKSATTEPPESNEDTHETNGETQNDGDDDNSEDEDDSGEEDAQNSGLVPKKNVEPALKAWIETKQCRRNKVDEYFDNPPRTERKWAS